MIGREAVTFSSAARRCQTHLPRLSFADSFCVCPLSGRQCCGSRSSIFVLETRRICPQAAIMIAISRFVGAPKQFADLRVRVSRREINRCRCTEILLSFNYSGEESALINFAARKRR